MPTQKGLGPAQPSLRQDQYEDFSSPELAADPDLLPTTVSSPPPNALLPTTQAPLRPTYHHTQLLCKNLQKVLTVSRQQRFLKNLSFLYLPYSKQVP